MLRRNWPSMLFLAFGLAGWGTVIVSALTADWPEAVSIEDECQ